MLEGEVDHADSLGNRGVIGPGDVQWMTAGSGIIHQEMPRGNEQGRMGGFQLWANLPAAHKMTDPRYQGIGPAEIPEVKLGGATIRVIAGKVGEVVGPIVSRWVDPEYMDVALEARRILGASNHTGVRRVGLRLRGCRALRGRQRPVVADPGRIVLLGDGDSVAVTAGGEGGRLLFASGRPLREPIAWRGPIVMNSAKELDDAWRELDEGTFTRHPGGCDDGTDGGDEGATGGELRIVPATATVPRADHHARSCTRRSHRQVEGAALRRPGRSAKASPRSRSAS